MTSSAAFLATKSGVDKPKFDFDQFNLGAPGSTPKSDVDLDKPKFVFGKRDRGAPSRLTFGGATEQGEQRVDVYIVVVPMTDGHLHLFRAREVPKCTHVLLCKAYAGRLIQQEQRDFKFELGKESRLFPDHKTNHDTFMWLVDVNTPHAYNYNLQIILTEFVRDTDPELRLAAFRAYQRDYPSITLDGKHQIIPIDNPYFASARRDFVPGTFLSYEIVDSHQRLAEQAVYYLRDVQGIRSPIAMYFILRTALSRRYGSVLTIEKSAAMWRSYQAVFRRIDADIRRAPAQDAETTSGQAIDDVRFAVKAMMHLKFPSEETVLSACPFARPGQNFITALFSHECVCKCYTAYILAAADEVKRPAIMPIQLSGHVTVAILDTTRLSGHHEIQTAVDDCLAQSRNAIPESLRKNVPEAAFALSAMTWESDPVHPICAIVEAGFETNQEHFKVKTDDPQIVDVLGPFFDSRRVQISHTYFLGSESPCGLFGRADDTWDRFSFVLNAPYAELDPLPVDRLLLELICIAHIFRMQPYRLFGVFLRPNIPTAVLTKRFDEFIEIQSQQWHHAPLPMVIFKLFRVVDQWRKLATVRQMGDEFRQQMEHAQNLRNSLRATPQKFVDVTLFACDRAGPDDLLVGVVIIAGRVLSRILTLPSRSICRDFIEPLVGADEYDRIKRGTHANVQVNLKVSKVHHDGPFRILEHQQTRELFFVLDGSHSEKIVQELPETHTLDSLGFTPMHPRLAQEILDAFTT